MPMLADTGWDRTTFGIAMAIQNLLWGLGQPFFGAIADKFGTWRVLASAGLIYAAGLIMMAHADTPTMLYISGGVLVGLGVAGGSFTIVLAAFARNVAPERRPVVFGVGMAAGSAGMFLFAPISQGLISAYGWSDALVYLGIAMLALPLLAIPLAGNASSGSQAVAQFQQSAGQALREAFGHRSYVLLTAGFFVCGFHVSFIMVHLPAFAIDQGLPGWVGPFALSVVGIANIVGTFLAGQSGPYIEKRRLLSLIYLARAVLFLGFLFLPVVSSRRSSARSGCPCCSASSSCLIRLAPSRVSGSGAGCSISPSPMTPCGGSPLPSA
jgi:MFS family permease